MNQTELFSLKESIKYPGLFVKKYKKKVFFDNLWDDELIESRGKVLLSDGTVIVNPFTKIFNYGENGTSIPDTGVKCLWVQKINGFMAAATYVSQINEVIISTTGSLDSPFVDMAKEFMTEKILNKIKEKSGYTFLFEVCHPDDPHIIKEEEGLYLIGIRVVNDCNPYFSSLYFEEILDEYAANWGIKRPKYGIVNNFDSIKISNKSAKDEGVIVYADNGTVLKMKTPYYLVTKAIARIKDITKLSKQKVDEEFYPLLDYVKSIPNFSELDEQSRINEIIKYYDK